ncbi:uncharacterized protein C3orf14 homolog isoform X2 [Cygnus olor]|uniref:uncharacterized protein C3orf14 homolog isoform X2 n=1 Tax=Cygnus olor TaxID=8869 RepID=UPI001ADE9231|nr:uncharacterized protein C3orf14 homolog isoform X2 [Cygnus olor]
MLKLQSSLTYSDRQLKMSSYLAQEVHLARRHEEILSQRSVLLRQMETYLGDKKTKKTWQTQAADAARKRNAALLNVSPVAARSPGAPSGARRELPEAGMLRGQSCCRSGSRREDSPRLCGREEGGGRAALCRFLVLGWGRSGGTKPHPAAGGRGGRFRALGLAA